MFVLKSSHLRSMVSAQSSENYFNAIFVSLLPWKAVPAKHGKVMGPTGFDRMPEVVYKHAGSWNESLER